MRNRVRVENRAGLDELYAKTRPGSAGTPTIVAANGQRLLASLSAMAQAGDAEVLPGDHQRGDRGQHQAEHPARGPPDPAIGAGPVFAAAGGGVRYLISKKVAATGALKLQGAFGGQAGFLFGVVPELGIQMGF